MNTLLPILSSLILAFLSLCSAGGRPIELKIVRNSTTKSCQFLSIQETQLHKGLLTALKSGQRYVMEVPRYPSGSVRGRGEELSERFHLFSYDANLLRDQARSLCGHEESSWDFPVFDFYTTKGTYGHLPPGQHILASSPLDGLPPLEVQPLLESGAAKNRIDLVFFADGYTLQEKAMFFADATRLANDISKNQTFYTVRPLLNIWAAFTPSVDSGIGVGGIPKDTAFGLYRDGTELRGVYYSKPNVARLACTSMGDRCDYPILMGNDPSYGGLGGEFTVITPSVLNGALVLRHELGHSIIGIGEEYDGGDEQGYFGCNAADTPEDIGWTHWLSHPAIVKGVSGQKPKSSPSRVERMVMSLQQYPWTLLNSTYSAKFYSPGTYPSNLIRFSISGIPESDQLSVLLDGNDLGWRVKEGIGMDRYFYEFWRMEDAFGESEGLSEGEHEIDFVLNYPAADGIWSGPQLCSVEVLEYGNANEFNSTSGYYGIFPTFSEKNTTSYRPTNEDCLMRQVKSPNLCKVCVEGLWLSLMNRIDVIENAEEGCHLEYSDDVDDEGWVSIRDDMEWRWKRSFRIDLLPLAEFRTNETLLDKQEAYEIIWSRRRADGTTRGLQYGRTSTSSWSHGGLEHSFDWLRDGKRQVFHHFTNSTKLVLDEIEDEVQEGDVISVDVRFWTEEVRVDNDRHLTGSHEWVVGTRCGSY